jgi:hypothetical protein
MTTVKSTTDYILVTKDQAQQLDTLDMNQDHHISSRELYPSRSNKKMIKNVLNPILEPGNSDVLNSFWNAFNSEADYEFAYWESYDFDSATDYSNDRITSLSFEVSDIANNQNPLIVQDTAPEVVLNFGERVASYPSFQAITYKDEDGNSKTGTVFFVDTSIGSGAHRKPVILPDSINTLKVRTPRSRHHYTYDIKSPGNVKERATATQADYDAIAEEMNIEFGPRYDYIRMKTPSPTKKGIYRDGVILGNIEMGEDARILKYPYEIKAFINEMIYINFTPAETRNPKMELMFGVQLKPVINPQNPHEVIDVQLSDQFEFQVQSQGELFTDQELQDALDEAIAGYAYTSFDSSEADDRIASFGFEIYKNPSDNEQFEALEGIVSRRDTRIELAGEIDGEPTSIDLISTSRHTHNPFVNTRLVAGENPEEILISSYVTAVQSTQHYSFNLVTGEIKEIK